MAFNPNELILEKIRAVEEYDPSTDELMARYVQIEEPSLSTGADKNDVTDAMGTPIMSFYRNQTGSFSFQNSLISLDMMASQFGSEKEIADVAKKIQVPVSETVTIQADGTAVLKYTPVGAAAAQVKYAKVINANNTFGDTYTVSPTAAAKKFTCNAATKTLTFPTELAGSRVFVNYTKETDAAVRITKTTSSVPAVRKLLIHAIFHDPCNKNLVYAGVIVVPRAEHDITNVEVNLASDGKHSATYSLQSTYCGSDDQKLFEILVSED